MKTKNIIGFSSSSTIRNVCISAKVVFCTLNKDLSLLPFQKSINKNTHTLSELYPFRFPKALTSTLRILYLHQPFDVIHLTFYLPLSARVRNVQIYQHTAKCKKWLSSKMKVHTKSIQQKRRRRRRRPTEKLQLVDGWSPCSYPPRSTQVIWKVEYNKVTAVALGVQQETLEEEQIIELILHASSWL